MAASLNPIKGQNGVALVTILLVLAVLATLAIYAAEDQDLSIRRVSNLVTAEQGYQVNISGEQWVVKVLEKDMENDQLNVAGDQPVIDHVGEVWGNLGPPVEVGETGMTLWMQVDDLQGRFNVNNLLQGREVANTPGSTDGTGNDGDEAGDGSRDEATEGQNQDGDDGETVIVSDEAEEEEEQIVLWHQILRNLFVSLELNPELVDPMMDWIDADESPIGTTGAEDFYYTGLDIPYRTPNRAMASTAELTELKDFEPKIVAALSPWVTALPVAGADNTTPVNVNTASAQVLAAFAVNQPLDPAALEPLVARRQSTPFENLADFQSEFEALVAGGLVPGHEDMLDVASNFYAGRSCAQSGRVKFSMTSLMQKMSADNNVKVLQRERFFGCPTFPQSGDEAQ